MREPCDEETPVVPTGEAGFHMTAMDDRRAAWAADAKAPPADGKDAPAAAFAPDGSLVALVTAAEGRLRSLAVFV